ncbi:MAG: YceI family protein [Ignavibacteria bacterium]|nr:YceI family protein [Ignavibacteria bacterium]
MRHLLSILTIAMISFSSLVANTPEWKLDKGHSNVMFTVTHLVISEVMGRFNDFDVTLRTSKDDFSDAAVEAVVQVGSIDTDNERRDGHLKSDDFFNAESFPTMKFAATKFEKVGERSYKITGNLTIRDVTKSVTFDAVNLGTVKSEQMGTRTGWKATAKINRFDYSLKWNRAIEAGGLVVGQDVTITLNLQFRQ